MHEVAELHDTKAEAEFEVEVERIALMSIVEVHAHLRKFGLEPTKSLPPELKQLLNSSRRSRKTRLDGLVSFGRYIVWQLTQPAWKPNAVQLVAVVLVFVSAFAFWKATSRGPVGDPNGSVRINVNSRPAENINYSPDRPNNEPRDIVKQIVKLNRLDRGSNAEAGSADEATTRPPRPFVPVEDLNGFHREFWIGHRQSNEPFILQGQPPAAVLNASRTTIRLPCTVQGWNSTDCPVAGDMHVALTTNASDPDGDTLSYYYAPSGGRIVGEGVTVTWDLSGVGPGTYQAVVKVDDPSGLDAEAVAEVKVIRCTDTKASSANSGTPLSKREERDRAYSRRESRAGGHPQRKQGFHQPVL